MRGHALDSLRRGGWPIAGSVSGAFAVPVAHYAASSPAIASVGLAGVERVSLYAALTSRRAFGRLFVGLTFALIMLGKLENRNVDVANFVLTRILEVFAGTFACLLVSTLSAITLRKWLPAERRLPRTPSGWHPLPSRAPARIPVPSQSCPGSFP